MSVFVTVGTTSFDELIETICSEKACEALLSRGYHNVTIQLGRGNNIKNVENSPLTFNSYRLKSSIKEDIKAADLVISHAGAGSCLEVLEAGKKLLVVVNEKLMNNHQIELANQLYQDGHLVYCVCSNLVETINKMDLSSLIPLPEPKTVDWARSVADHFGL